MGIEFHGDVPDAQRDDFPESRSSIFDASLSYAGLG